LGDNQSNVVVPVTNNHWILGQILKVNHFDHKVNMYNSKHMAVIPHVTVYYVIQCNLIHSFLHACIYKYIIFIILLFINHFHKIEFTVF